MSSDPCSADLWRPVRRLLVFYRKAMTLYVLPGRPRPGVSHSRSAAGSRPRTVVVAGAPFFGRFAGLLKPRRYDFAAQKPRYQRGKLKVSGVSSCFRVGQYMGPASRKSTNRGGPLAPSWSCLRTLPFGAPMNSVAYPREGSGVRDPNPRGRASRG